MAKKILPVYSIDTLSSVPISPRDFTVDHFSHYLDEHPNLQFPHKHSFYHLVYFSKGSGKHSIDFVNFIVEPGQVYFMIPGQVHSWAFKTKPDGFIINFSEQFLHSFLVNPRYLDQFSFFSGTANEQVGLIPKTNRAEIEKLFEIIIEESKSKSGLKDDFTRTSLLQLFIKISRYSFKEAKGKIQNSNSIILKNFQKLIEQNYKQMKLTRDYASLLYVTPNHLNALCKDLTGRSAGELIRDRVLLEAKRLLVNAGLTVAEIAVELDFADNSYFSKFFKKYEGVTPDVFRKKL